ncbi:hypothetical protein GTF03_10115 [Roseobacter sp. HKCCD7415]|uniref:hypothetical protein n=1 Tax=unclassified Roseobacter TaxID=196798 RepID=UPI001492EFED|nr:MULTISPECIES: hypothetical protein [unclassified Roseobacter]NNV85831.1 hypothetical protein [Roseobacter sp. HKCCD8414]NNV94550.1 hypothetical protein [Roseobacter sp. HKCCD8914]NNW11348.1 hypothetical protein [Roseobacter sp. HKCCD8484]NNW19870.1 hypothetical protein [Roseobacter sp. HKCCD7543]NNW41176.1 hypothetical protein [Roseobacter sp. HKCCD8654]NNW45558.1 hypothetical protein [Roseobacter sp. HKCCD8291]NNW62522.1 hypothetical protein [Roseobacter sp. HKCCD8268]NNW88202.1 hypothe
MVYTQCGCVEIVLAKCRYCERRGLFLQTDNNGLCRRCSDEHVPQIANLCRIVVESGKIVDRSKNEKTIVSRCDVALGALDRLEPYYRASVPTLDVPIPEIKTEFLSIRSGAIGRLVNSQVFAARAKRESAATPAARLGGYAKAIDNLNKFLIEFEDVTAVEPAIAELVRERDQVRVENAMLKSEKLLAKGKAKLAKEALIDALVDIRHDTTPDADQAKEIAALEAKIAEIDGAT